MQNVTTNCVDVSQRKLARKCGVWKTTLHDNLKKLGLKYYKRQKAPKYTEQQLRQIPRKCKNIRCQLTTVQTLIIVDDEKYFSFSNNVMPGNTGFYALDKKTYSS